MTTETKMTEQKLIDACATAIPGYVPTFDRAREIAKRVIEIVDSARLRERREAEQGEVVVTRDEDGEIVLVSRQDSEGRILSVIAQTTYAGGKHNGEQGQAMSGDPCVECGADHGQECYNGCVGHSQPVGGDAVRALPRYECVGYDTAPDEEGGGPIMKATPGGEWVKSAELEAALSTQPAPSTPVVDDAMIERGAEAIWKLPGRVGWPPKRDDMADEWRGFARACLTAALSAPVAPQPEADAGNGGRVIGSRTINGVHVVVVAPFSSLLDEQLLVRYDDYLAAAEAAPGVPKDDVIEADCTGCGAKVHAWPQHRHTSKCLECVADDALQPAPGKYDDVLKPFVAMMERELHANAGKGDRPGWLQMDRKTALLEIYYHLAKLQKAAKNDEPDAIREYAADVANMSMMLVDVCGLLTDSRAGEKAHG